MHIKSGIRPTTLRILIYMSLSLLLGAACAHLQRDSSLNHAVQTAEQEAEKMLDSKDIEGLEQRAQHDDAAALTTLGRAYLEGDAVDEDIEQGLELLERAAAQEYAPALLALGRYYDQDASLFDRDKPRARTYLERASNLNNAEATYLLGQSSTRAMQPSPPTESTSKANTSNKTPPKPFAGFNIPWN